MKNKIFALALIAVGLVSCTNDEVQPTKAAAKASLDIGFKTDSQNSTTGKSVNRGNLHSWIKDINITATSTEFTYSVSELFNLVATGGDSDFHLDDIAVGHNKIDVTTTCSTQPVGWNFLYYGNDVTSVMAEVKARNPYAIYSTTINDFNVVQGATNKLENVELTTQHGRAIAVFQLSETLKQSGVYAMVTPVGNGLTLSSDFAVHPTHTSVFYWSDANSTDGKTLKFVIHFYKESDGTQFSPESISSSLITIVPSKSINKIYTIDKEILNTNETSQTSFTAQLWNSGDVESETLTGN